MRLKTQKLLLNLSTLGLLSLGVAGLLVLLLVPIDNDGDEALSVNASLSGDSVKDAITSQLSLDVNHPVWSRPWRQPLYDPPPPPPVVAAPRPITVKLMGTIIEPDNSQAFLQSSSGSVELKRLGDQISTDPADGSVAAIYATEITIKREDGEHQLKVSQ